MENGKNKNVKRVILCVIVTIVVIGLIICFAIAYNNIKTSNNQVDTTNTSKNVTSEKTTSNNESSSKVTKQSDENNLSITEGGSYDLSAEYESITVDTDEEVTLNLNGVEISNSAGPAINIVEAKTVTIVLNGTNKITAETTEDLDGAIYSKADLIFEGTGSLEVKSNYDGIVSKDTLVIKDGTYTITSDDDGIRGKDSVEISNGSFTIDAGGDGIKASNDEDTSLGYVTITGGTFDIKAKSDGVQAITQCTISGGTFNLSAAEGIEATNVKIDDGTINISASDDGINASQKSNIGTPTVTINGGNITIKMGQGDTDAIDSNGNIYINGGTINITGNSPFDYDGTAQKNGGTLIINGTETSSITNQMMGGGMNMNNNMNGDFPGEMNPNGGSPQMNGGRGMR